MRSVELLSCLLISVAEIIFKMLEYIDESLFYC